MKTAAIETAIIKAYTEDLAILIVGKYLQTLHDIEALRAMSNWTEETRLGVNPD